MVLLLMVRVCVQVDILGGRGEDGWAVVVRDAAGAVIDAAVEPCGVCVSRRWRYAGGGVADDGAAVFRGWQLQGDVQCSGEDAGYVWCGHGV